MLDEVIALIEHPQHSALFGPDSQAEVSLAGFVELDGVARTVSGQVDRLIVTQERVVIVDYKTNRHPPSTPDAIPMAYQLQMALYAELLASLYPGKIHSIPAAVDSRCFHNGGRCRTTSISTRSRGC